MMQQRQQRRSGGVGVGVGVGVGTVLLLALALALLSLCLARADAVSASLAGAGAAPASFSEHGVATALENALAQEVVARGHSTPSTAAEEGGHGDVVLERAALESTEDYSYAGPNNRHVPHP